MKTTITIYRNYGVATAEKRQIYTHGGPHPNAVCSDRLTVLLPEHWSICKNAAGNTLITAPWEWNYEINDILAGDRKPCFQVFDHHRKKHIIYLEEITERRSKSSCCLQK